MSSQQNFFQKVTTRADSIVKASFVIAYLIARKSKPFTDGEFIKQCIESMVDTCLLYTSDAADDYLTV